MAVVDYRIGNARQSTARQRHKIITIIEFLFFLDKGSNCSGSILNHFQVNLLETSVFMCIHVVSLILALTKSNTFLAGISFI